MKSKCWLLFLWHRWNNNWFDISTCICWRNARTDVFGTPVAGTWCPPSWDTTWGLWIGTICYIQVQKVDCDIFCTSRRKATTPHSFPSLSPGNKEISTSCGFVWGRIAFIRTIQNSKLPPCLFLQSYAAWEDLFSLLRPRVKSASEVMSDIHTWDEESHL